MSLPRVSHVLPLLALSLLVSGCELVGDLLEFGFWAVVIIALVIVALILWVARKLRRPRRGPPPPRA